MSHRVGALSNQRAQKAFSPSQRWVCTAPQLFAQRAREGVNRSGAWGLNFELFRIYFYFLGLKRRTPNFSIFISFSCSWTILMRLSVVSELQCSFCKCSKNMLQVWTFIEYQMQVWDTYMSYKGSYLEFFLAARKIFTIEIFISMSVQNMLSHAFSIYRSSGEITASTLEPSSNNFEWISFFWCINLRIGGGKTATCWHIVSLRVLISMRSQ